MTFDEAFAKLIEHEGGYVNDPADPGGETKYGISRRAYPGEDIAGMTLERAKTIYQRDYWGPAGCDAVPPGVKFQVFDCAVNSGVAATIKLVQRAVCTVPDGVLGPQTLMAIQSMPVPRFVARFNAQRLALLVGLPTWPRFGRGWVLRAVDNLMEA